MKLAHGQSPYLPALACACALLGFGDAQTRSLILRSLPPGVRIHLASHNQPYKQVLSDLIALAELSLDGPEHGSPLMIYLTTGLELILNQPPPPGDDFDPGPGWSRHFTGAPRGRGFTVRLEFDPVPHPHLVIVLQGGSQRTLRLGLGEVVGAILRAFRLDPRSRWRSRRR